MFFLTLRWFVISNSCFSEALHTSSFKLFWKQQKKKAALSFQTLLSVSYSLCRLVCQAAALFSPARRERSASDEFTEWFAENVQYKSAAFCAWNLDHLSALSESQRFLNCPASRRAHFKEVTEVGVNSWMCILVQTYRTIKRSGCCAGQPIMGCPAADTLWCFFGSLFFLKVYHENSVFDLCFDCLVADRPGVFLVFPWKSVLHQK